jgi:hypothetical protein
LITTKMRRGRATRHVLEDGRRLGRVLEPVYGHGERGVARDLDLEPLLDAFNRDRRLGADTPLEAVLPTRSPAEPARDAQSALGRAFDGATIETLRLGSRGFDRIIVARRSTQGARRSRRSRLQRPKGRLPRPRPEDAGVAAR